jgi:hypothetical protein
MRTKLIAAFLALQGMAAVAAAQGVTGTVSGTVKDAQGAVIPGATISLISESRGTTIATVTSNASGDFVVPNVTADTYTIQITMPSFKTLKRTGLMVSAGGRVTLGTVTIDVGQRAEEVTVKGDTPIIRPRAARSPTRSPRNRWPTAAARPRIRALLGLMPGVQVTGGLTPAQRLGGGGDSNFMLDGSTSMDPGVNRPATRVACEAIQEGARATSAYQAEYGRASGLQVNAVEERHEQVRGIGLRRRAQLEVELEQQDEHSERRSEAFQDERDYGFAIGGPVGKPGGANKLFFYFTMEMQPRTVGGDVTRYRMPTLLERQGDFSKSTNNLGQPYPYIKDPSKTGACNATSQVACFNDGGVLGKIPQSALYAPGMAILNWYPLPTITDVPVGQTYNFETTYPKTDLIGYQPVVRLDYQPFSNLRGSFKFFEYQQPADPIQGILQGWNDTREDNYGIWVPAANVNWTINNTTFASSRGAATTTTRKAVRSPAPGRISAATRCRSTPSPTATRPASARSRTSFPTPRCSIRRRLPTRSSSARARRSGTASACRWRRRSPGRPRSRTRRRTTSVPSATSSWTRRPATSTPASRG